MLEPSSIDIPRVCTLVLFICVEWRNSPQQAANPKAHSHTTGMQNYGTCVRIKFSREIILASISPPSLMSFSGYTSSERVCEVVPEEETCPISYIAVENEKKGQWSLIKHVVQNLHEAY